MMCRMMQFRLQRAIALKWTRAAGPVVAIFWLERRPPGVVLVCADVAVLAEGASHIAGGEEDRPRAFRTAIEQLGEETDPRTLAAIAWTLRREGCHNINWVGGEVVIHLHAIVDVSRSGFGEIAMDRVTEKVGGGTLDETAGMMLRLGPLDSVLDDIDANTRGAILADVRDALAGFESQGRVWLEAVSWLVTARTP
jgi:hypothetical protein